jgi:hypothetical protein
MNQVERHMAQDHRELETFLKQLQEDVEAPECAAMHCTWCELEERLLGHLLAEEHHLLPLIEADHPAGVARTLAEHDEIRRQVSELGAAIELHTVRHPAIQELIRTLQAHARFEDETLYPLAGEKASPVLQQRIGALLKAAVRLAKAASLGLSSTSFRLSLREQEPR